jgi:hypothetical protein
MRKLWDGSKLYSRDNGEVFAEELVTAVDGLSYDFVKRCGRLSLPEHCHTDMAGCIKLFETIDAGVQRPHLQRSAIG